MTLALIAGNGDLPLQIIEACHQQKRSLKIIKFEGQTDSFVDNSNTVSFPLGAISKIIAYLKENNIKEIVLAGGLRRPSLSEIELDWLGAKWLKTLGWRALKGDDTLLSGILELLEKEGFQIIKANDILSTLLIDKEIYTDQQPTSQAWQDIERGKEILNALAPYDVGQSIIVQQGLVLGIEAIEGTANLIKRCQDYKRAGQDRGVLIKMAKLNQSMAVDLPTIGPDTIKQLYDCGLNGAALSKNSTQIIHLDETIRLANELGIFIVGMENG